MDIEICVKVYFLFTLEDYRKKKKIKNKKKKFTLARV